MTNTGNRIVSECNGFQSEFFRKLQFAISQIAFALTIKVLFSSGLQLIFTNDLIYVSKLPSRRKQLKDYTSGI